MFGQGKKYLLWEEIQQDILGIPICSNNLEDFSPGSCP